LTRLLRYHNQVANLTCWLEWTWVMFFKTFLYYIFFLRFNFSIFCLLKIEFQFFFFLLYLRLSCSRLFIFLRYQTRSFNIWFFLKLIFLILISSFGVWLIRNRSLCFFFSFFFLWGYINLISIITWLVSLFGLTRGFFHCFLIYIFKFCLSALSCLVIKLNDFIHFSFNEITLMS
jgi:hypothetical protein